MAKDTAPKWDKREMKEKVRKWLAQGATPRELVAAIDEEAKDTTPVLDEQFCRVSWDVEDVQCALEISDEDAAKFLREIDSDMDDAMVSAGWTVIETLGRQKGFKPVETIDDDDEEYEDE